MLFLFFSLIIQGFINWYKALQLYLITGSSHGTLIARWTADQQVSSLSCTWNITHTKIQLISPDCLWLYIIGLQCKSGALNTIHPFILFVTNSDLKFVPSGNATLLPWTWQWLQVRKMTVFRDFSFSSNSRKILMSGYAIVHLFHTLHVWM